MLLAVMLVFPSLSLAQSSWVCAHPGIIEGKETTVVSRYRIQGSELIEDGPLRVTRFHILQNTPDGLMALMHPTIAGKPVFSAFILIINKRTLAYRISVVYMHQPTSTTEGSCVTG